MSMFFPVALEESFCESDQFWHFSADSTASFNEHGFGTEGSGFLLSSDYPVLVGTPLRVDGDWFREEDDVVRGLTLGPSVSVEFDGGQKCDFMSRGLTSSTGFGMDMVFDDTRISNLTDTSFGCTDMSSAKRNERPMHVPDSARFEEGHAAPVEHQDSVFFGDAATSIRLRGVSPCEAANCVLDNLRGREGVAILKINPRKLSIKAAVCFSMGLSCEFKVYVNEGFGFDRSEQSNNAHVRSARVATLEFQRRSGDSVAFWRIVEALQADLMAGVGGEFFAGSGDSARTVSNDHAARHISSPLLHPIGSTIAGQPPIVSISTAVDVASVVAVSDHLDRRVVVAGVDFCIESSEDVSSKPFAPLFDSMSQQHVHDREASAELASALQTAAEVDPHSIARLCGASISTCKELAHLLTASAFSIAYPISCALAAIAQCTEAAHLLLGCTSGSQFPRLATLVLERLYDIDVDSMVKRQMALSLCRLSRQCSAWLVGDGVIHDMVMALQRLLLAPTLEDEMHAQTRSWLKEALATLTVGNLKSSECL